VAGCFVSLVSTVPREAKSMRNAFAFDRSARTVDADGRLHVAGCRISKAAVNPYAGAEIPDYEALGLDPARQYMLYRDSQELAKAAATFENMPLLLDHVPVNADAPAQELICGTVSNVRFDAPYLVADVTVWRQDAIDAIESGERREISCAYRFQADMTAGVHRDGQRFDGVMRNLQANHVALVAEGRAGPDVMVADAAPRAVGLRLRVADLWPGLGLIRRT
jgi:hypothetical protein